MARFIRVCAAALSSPNKQETYALIVNRFSEIVPVDRAVLVPLKGRQVILAVSGGGMAAQDSSFADAVDEVRRRYRTYVEPIKIPKLSDDIPSTHPLNKVQQAMGGTQILWLPLWIDNEHVIRPEYALWLERWHQKTWEIGEIEMAKHAGLFLGHALLRPKKPLYHTNKRIIQVFLLIIILATLFLPVSSSITAPFRVVPDRPHHIFAPMDGILNELLVQPGQHVKANDVLFRYDSRVLDKRLDEAYRNVAVARAKLVRLEGAAYRDPEARAEIPAQRLEVERAESDVAFFARQLARAEVRTQKSGVVVLDDPDALVGASLMTGQLVMSIADPSQTKLRIMIPASDTGMIEEGVRIDARLDSNPLKSLPAVITRIGFEIKLSEDRIPSVLAEAIWTSSSIDIQPGQKGSAKIYGHTTRLGFQIIRKPLIRLRMILGW